MMQDCASANKIKENKYKILRMSLLLGSDENQDETIQNFEDAAREIDVMNDEIYLKDLEGKFYDTKTLEEEEKKLAVLVDYIGGRVEQRISLLSDFSNVTGYDLSNLPSIKYYDKLDDYKDRLKYIREYLQNTDQIKNLNQEIEEAEQKLKEAYLNKATSEECNQRNEEIILNKFENIIRSIKELKEINETNIDARLNEIITQVEESKKSLDIFNKSFKTLSGSGISYEEEQEYKSYVENAKDVYYANKEQEYLLRIYQYLLKKETDYNSILMKRESMNIILYERMDLRKELNITEGDILNNIYDILERQYEDIKRQKENIEDIELLTEAIEIKKEKVNDLEIENQKVEILALLREFGLIETYTETTTSETTKESTIPETPSSLPLEEPVAPEEVQKEETPQPETNEEWKQNIEIPNFFETPIPTQETKIEISPKDNEVILIEDATKIDLDLIHAKANKVMQRVGEMLGIKTTDTKIVSVENKVEEKPKVPESQPEVSPELEEEKSIPENPLFSNTLETQPDPEESKDISNFWFESDTPDALNELPDLTPSNDNFFANNNMPDLNFPDLQFNFGNEEETK